MKFGKKMIFGSARRRFDGAKEESNSQYHEGRKRRKRACCGIYHLSLMHMADLTTNQATNLMTTYLVWMIYAMGMLMLATIITHYLSIQAIGSGIPEMKTILQGVELENYLSFRTLLAKFIGLSLTIGSGFPVGKEGPFVHMGSIVAHLLKTMVQRFKPEYASDSRSYELLAAGCAAGVAATFSAPIGGVLFSIEVTTVYFAVRDYWRGFFAAACGAVVFSLLRLYTNPTQVTIAALYQTRFKHRAFYPEELLVFACIGVFCGATGAIFIFIHRRYVLFLRRNEFMKKIFQRNWIVYPIVIAALYSTITYPYGFGQWLTEHFVFSHSLKDFFLNCTWHVNPSHIDSCGSLLTIRWSGDTSIFTQLTIFIVAFYFLSIVASTLPVPNGIFMPTLVIGAAMGRFFGEVMAYAYPDGVRNDPQMLIIPGIYAVIGGVSFCGAVTHTVSVAVIAFELTGQVVHILPAMISVLIANIICSSIQPSFFDSIIKIKHLPYMPDVPKSNAEAHKVRVQQIMVKNVQCLSQNDTYFTIKELLLNFPKTDTFPLVNDRISMLLIGSVSRENLLRLLDSVIGDEARKEEARRRARNDQEIITSTTKSVKFSGVSSKSLDDLTYTDVNDQSTIKRHGSLETSTECGLVGNLKSSTSEFDVRQLKNTRRKRNLGSKLRKCQSGCELYETIGSMFKEITYTLRGKKKTEATEFDDDERRKWEIDQLNMFVDYPMAMVDPAPFQLVEHTSLYKLHSTFSMLGIRTAFVTKCGILVGVVSINEVVSAVERLQSGLLIASTRNEDQFEESRTSDEDSDELDNDAFSSESDNEDVIMPRVEVVRAPIVAELEAKFAEIAIKSDDGGSTSARSRRRKSYPSSFSSHTNTAKAADKYSGRLSLDAFLEHGVGILKNPLKRLPRMSIDGFTPTIITAHSVATDHPQSITTEPISGLRPTFSVSFTECDENDTIEEQSTCSADRSSTYSVSKSGITSSASSISPTNLMPQSSRPARIDRFGMLTPHSEPERSDNGNSLLILQIDDHSSGTRISGNHQQLSTSSCSSSSEAKEVKLPTKVPTDL